MNVIVFINTISLLLAACASSNKQEPKINQLKWNSLNHPAIEMTKISTMAAFKSIWEDLAESNDINHFTLPNFEIFRLFEQINQNITALELTINSNTHNLLNFDRNYVLVKSEINNINLYYETLVKFTNRNFEKKSKLQNDWTYLAETYLQTSEFGIVKSLEQIDKSTILETDSETLFQTILKEIQTKTCNPEQSPQQITHNLYNTVALAKLKGNIILQFSYLLLQMNGKGNFTQEALRRQIKYEENAEKQRRAFTNALQRADTSIFKCDPQQYVEGINYNKLTKLLQGYIENEVNLNIYGTCRENCAYYSYTKYNGCFKNQFCAQQPPCKGKVVECQYFDSDMHVCLSSKEERRYEWIQYENGKTLGNKGACENRNLFEVDSWWRYLFWHCSYCLCLCDDSSDSDRYFNLRNVTSDIENNKILTGVRFVKHNRIIHIQIQEGNLGPSGSINTTTLFWKPVENYTIDDKNIEPNVDYHTMNWVERAIDIDDLVGPPEHVVTGIRFRKVGTHLNLELRITPFDFSAGKILRATHSYWLGNDNTNANFVNPRTEIKLVNPDIPIRNGPHLLNSKHDQFIYFQQSSFANDAAQNTVPFLDSQALSSQGFPLSGIGLIHRGKINSGGFIALKLITYNITPHFNYNQ